MAYLIEAIGSKEQRGSLVIQNGIINAPERAIHLVDCDLKLKNVKINAVERCIGAYNNAKVEIDCKSELTSTGDDACVFFYSTTGRTDAVGELELDGTIQSTGNAAGTWTLCGNGSANHGTTKFTINKNAKILCAADSAIYHPQGGLLTVNGGLIEGKDGIYMKSGKLIVNDGIIRATGEANAYVASGNGTENPLGNGIVVEFSDYPAGLPKVEINGGVIEAENNDAVGYYVSDKCVTNDLEALIAENVTDKRK